MFNLFKMYCYKMFRQKSLYAIWLIMLLFEFISVMMIEGGFAEHSADMGAFYIVLVSIFPTIFFSADINSGYIKNYAGSISHRSMITTARVIMTVVQNLLTLGFTFISIYTITVIRGAEIGDISFIVKYYVCAFLAGLACSFMSIMFVELTRKTVSSMILSICVGTGLISQVAKTFSAMFSNGSFDIGSFMVTSTFTSLKIDSAVGDFYTAIIVAICYIVISCLISNFSIVKRDVV